MTLRWIILLLMFLSGCATGPLYQTPEAPPDGYAQIVIYRIPTGASSAWPHHFWVDGKPAAELRINGYTHLQVKPGMHEVHAGGTADYRGAVVSINAQSGRTYYFRYGTTVTSIMMIGTTPLTSNAGLLNEVPDQLAKTELSNDDYHYQPPLTERIE